MLTKIMQKRNYIVAIHVFLTLSLISFLLFPSMKYAVFITIVYLILSRLTYLKGKEVTELAIKYIDLEKLLSGVFASVPDLIFYKDSNLDYVSCNDAFVEALKKPREEILGKKDFDLLPADIAQDGFETDMQVLQTKEPISFDKKYCKDDINPRVYSFIKSPILSEEGDVIGILGIARDVTEQNLMQENIGYKESQLNAILETMPLYAYMKDIDGKFVIGNKKVLELFGKTLGEMIGVYSYKLYENFYPEMNDIIDEEDKIVLRTKEPLSFERHLDTTKGKIWVELNKSPIINDESDVIGILVVIRDIECQKEVEKQKETFVATLTHDLKIPTIAQIKTLEILMNGALGPISELQKEAIEQIHNSCKYMFNMISTLLSTYRYEKGVKNMNYEQFDFVSLVSECSNEISCLAQDKEQVIVIKNKLNFAQVSADKLEIKRVITNLLSNAISYSFKNTEIEIIMENTDQEISCLIKNKSEIIPKEELDNLFGKYVSNASKYRQLGLGLGLYLSKQIIEAHQGSIFARSDAQIGNIFGFEIPIFEPAEGFELRSINNHSEVK
ncbi:MAG: PAS domain-containing protein [Candidatus Gastranaerophilales bacterium]|nr:PAS domain-containing protein [Candidatus Gastranaerophilales bacterium]